MGKGRKSEYKDIKRAVRDIKQAWVFLKDLIKKFRNGKRRAVEAKTIK
ncbi:hypothetical protein HRbin06_00673 [archaeon HR06]|nr:hypothetical protein HRbin06_00673 [archaeon HR06]